MPHTPIVPAKARICPRCSGSSLATPFYVRKNGRLSTHCVECEKIHVTERYTIRKSNLILKTGSLCLCGCGQITNVSTCSDRTRGLKVGDPLSYVYGHARRLSSVDYIVEDCGYKTPCWIWQLSKDNAGYGFITVPVRESGSRTGRAHAVYYERKYGPIPNGLVPDHLCRVHSCVNPDHIEPVTCAENTRRGLSAKLDVVKVTQIRQAIQDGQLQDAIAEQFGVSQTLVSRIKLRKAWRDVA